MTGNAPKIFIYTALTCEARCFIDNYKLKKDVAIRPFAVFLNDDICLTVTGLGKHAMAAGVAYTQALFAKVGNPVMLNVGIAGHAHHRLGDLFLIDKIIDNDSQKRYFPSLLFAQVCHTGSVNTSSIPQVSYDQQHLCDMEASAFYETAIRFTSMELIFCLKVISDNRSSPIENIQSSEVSALIAPHMACIQSIVLDAVAMVETITEPECCLFKQLTERYRFTVNERAQLKSLLSRWNVVTSHQPIEFNESGINDGKDVLRCLNLKIKQVNFSL